MNRFNSPLHPWMQKLSPPRSVVLVFGLYILGMLFFSLLRVLFLMDFSQLVQGESWDQIAKAFMIGLRFDQIIVLISLVPVMILTSWVKLENRTFRKTIISYLVIVFAIHFLLLLADIRFYSYFGSRLNFLAVEYIGEGSLFGNLVISDPQFYQNIFKWLLLSTVYAIILLFLVRGVSGMRHRRSRLNQIVYFTLLLALFALGIRGRISLAPMDWGVAYFSQNRFLNQLALNGIYTLGRNLTETNRDPRVVYLPENERFGLVDSNIALQTTRQMLRSDNDEWLEPSRSLLRITHQDDATFGFKPNIVIILSESWTARLTGSLGDNRDLTPNFDRLAKGGILFENFYASGTRTNFGISAVFCSFPALPGRAIMKRYNANHPFVSLSELLDERGYYNVFAYGGDLAFDNMEGFLREKKFRDFYGDRELGMDLYFSKWGIPDHIMFEKAAELVDSLPRPFQLTMLTLSNHEPWDLPDSSVRRYDDEEDSSKTFNSQIYADFSLGRFFDTIENDPVFDSTIFVFVSDHARYGGSWYVIDPEHFRIPLLIYSPRLLPDTGVVVSAYGSQTDILPTLMGLLGGDYTHASWGRNLFNLPEGDSGFAVMNLYNRLGYIDSRHLYVEELGGKTGFGSTGLEGTDQNWFGFATLKNLDVVGRPYTDEAWKDVFLGSLDSPTLFTTRFALNRIAQLGRGHLLIQTLKLNENDSLHREEIVPEALEYARSRLRRFVQAADQLSTPKEP